MDTNHIITDHMIDRRRLKRRLTLWRLVAISLAVVAVSVIVARADLSIGGDHVARLTVEGIIFSDPARIEAIKMVAKDDKAKALIVVIDSPGGTFVGSEILYRQLRKVAAIKPVVAVMAGTAASGGYMTALGADYIIAHPGTLTGSIGVIMQTADITELLGKIGIKPEIFKSGPYKAQPNPAEKITPQVRKVTQELLDDLYDMFVEMVDERRDITTEEVRTLSDGRVFSGRQAKNNGLVDALGDEMLAREWLEANHDIKASIPVKDVEIDYDDEPWRAFFGGTLGKLMFSERLRLDGVIALWHPELY